MYKLSNTKGAAALTNNLMFSPYGTAVSHNGNDMSLYTTKGFTGQYTDPTSGLDYYVARYYDPVAGIFLSADTKEGNAQGMNSMFLPRRCHRRPGSLHSGRSGGRRRAGRRRAACRRGDRRDARLC